MQGYLHQAPLHLGRTTQGRRGHGLCSPAPRRASARLKAISFIPLPLSHTLAQPPHSPGPSPNAPHTLSVLVWVPSRFAARRCGHTGRHSASLHVHCSRSAACARVRRTSTLVEWHGCACTCKSARPSGCRNAKCCARARRVLCFGVYVHFSGSVCFN